MKFLTTLLALVFTVSATAVAPYGIKGQNQSTTYQNVHQFPNNQVTNLGGINALVETGNDNILVNPSNEHTTNASGWTVGSGTYSADSTVFQHGKKSFKIVSSASNVALYQDSTLYATAFSDGIQGLGFIYAQNTAPNMYFCARKAGVLVATSDGTNITNCVLLNTDGKWALYKLPFILGGTSNGIEVVSLTPSTAAAVATTGTTNIDNTFLGAVDLKVDVDASKVAGESYFAGTASCDWNKASTTLGAFATTAACPGPTIATSTIGTWATTDSDLPRQTISNLPAGRYKATFQIEAYNSVSISGTAFAINDGTSTCEPVGGPNNNTSGAGLSVACTFNYTSSGSRVFELYSAAVSGTSTVLNSRTAPRSSVKFILEYYGANQLYSASCGASCVDVLSAKVSSTGVVTDENIDFINGNCAVTSTNHFECTYITALALANKLNCVIKENAVPQTTIFTIHEDISVSTALKLAYDTYSGATTQSADPRAVTLECQKTGSDFTATRTIVGSFKEVMTTPGVTKPVVYSADLSSACAVTTTKGSWIASSVDSTNQCTTTITTGKFANTPVCTCSAPAGAGWTACNIAASSATSVTTYTGYGATSSDTSRTIICHGEAP